MSRKYFCKTSEIPKKNRTRNVPGWSHRIPIELNSFPKKTSIIGRPKNEVFPRPAVNNKQPIILELRFKKLFEINKIPNVKRNTIQAITAGSKISLEKEIFGTKRKICAGKEICRIKALIVRCEFSGILFTVRRIYPIEKQRINSQRLLILSQSQ